MAVAAVWLAYGSWEFYMHAWGGRHSANSGGSIDHRSHNVWSDHYRPYLCVKEVIRTAFSLNLKDGQHMLFI